MNRELPESNGNAEHGVAIEMAISSTSSTRFFTSPFHSFQVWGLTGLAIALPFSTAIAAHAALSPVLMALIGLMSFATLLGTKLASKILTGKETLVFYWDAIAVLSVVGAIPRVLHQPVSSYMDATILGAGLFHSVARLGCLSAGCCHGRPSHWGIRYGKSHAECGFPSHYVGVRLFPVQAVESLFVFFLVAIGTAIVWKGAPPGTALSFYVTAYAFGRFFIEFARGDAERPYFWNFSEAQWTSAGLLWAVVFTEYRQLLPASRGHLLAAIALILCMTVVAAKRRLDGSRRFALQHPHHMRELAQAMRQISAAAFAPRAANSSANTPASPPVFTTSRGIQISGSGIEAGAQDIQHYCFSSRRTALTPAQADILVRTISLLRNERGPLELLQRRPGIFHLFLASVPNGPSRASTTACTEEPSFAKGQ
jgi:prolipoprotein diacylglyceryltransferase